MNLETNDVISVIEENFYYDIENIVQEFILDDGTPLFQNKFEEIVDEVRLEEIETIQLESFNVEDVGKGEKLITGQMFIAVYLSGYQYFDREYHYISGLEEDIGMKFSFTQEQEYIYSGFYGKCVAID